MKSLVIFDIDGTLADTNEVEGRCYIQAFNHTFGFDDKHQNWEVLQNVTDWGIAEEILFNKTGLNYSLEQISKMIPKFVKLLWEEYDRDIGQFSEVPGAYQFYHQVLQDDRFVVGIATGSWEDSGRMKLQSVNIDPSDVYFAHSNLFKSRENITRYVIDAAQKDHKEEFQKVVYFGDGVWDFKTCRNLGIDFIGIDVNGNGKLKKLGTKHVFNNYLDKEKLISIIQS